VKKEAVFFDKQSINSLKRARGHRIIPNESATYTELKLFE